MAILHKTKLHFLTGLSIYYRNHYTTSPYYCSVKWNLAISSEVYHAYEYMDAGCIHDLMVLVGTYMQCRVGTLPAVFFGAFSFAWIAVSEIAIISAQVGWVSVMFSMFFDLPTYNAKPSVMDCNNGFKRIMVCSTANGMQQ